MSGVATWDGSAPIGARARRPAREAMLIGAVAGSLAALLLWIGPPGTDLPAHLYQRALFIEHGFVLWNNFWYAGRYSFITYSPLYYPLAAIVGISVLAVASIATTAIAFALLVIRQWGPRARASGWAFAVVWPGTVLSATFPFSLGAALALLALCALQVGRRRLFAVLAVLSLVASPLAFAFLAIVIVGIGVTRRRERLRVGLPFAVIVGGALAEVFLFRLFPGEGRYPFTVGDLVPALAFAALGVLATFRLERARPLAGVFAIYGATCLVLFLVPTEIGGNMARISYAAVPLALLAVALRGWRPLRLVVPLAALAAVWNLTAVAGNFERSMDDPVAKRDQWGAAIAFLHSSLSPDYRVEAVDTVGHWAAVYLPEAEIPLVRGWYRQNDFPENDVLYGHYTAQAYRAWLRRLAVRYVVLSDAAPDYSSQAEAALLDSGRSGLTVAFRSAYVTVFSVPQPRPLVTGPADAHVRKLLPTRVLVSVGAPGTYRIAIRFSPYWRTLQGCVWRGPDDMVRVGVPRAGLVDLDFKVNLHRGFAVLTGSAPNRYCG